MRIRQALTFDDVLLVPCYSDISTRSLEIPKPEIDLSSNLGKGIKLKIPIISANMDTVTGPTMARAMAEMGGMGLLHRFTKTIQEQIADFQETIEGHSEYVNFVGCSLGISPLERNEELAEKLAEAGCRIFCIDVAHGHHKLVGEFTEYLAKRYPKNLLIAGNVATEEGAIYLYESGADVVKTGIGGGCFAAGTRVLMAGGFYKNIEEIAPGEKVINKNGEPVEVKRIIFNGFKEVYKLKNSLWYEDTFVTENHEYWIGDLNSVSKETVGNVGYVKLLSKKSKTKGKSEKIKWKKVENLKQDCLFLPNKINFEFNKDFNIPIIKRIKGNGQGKIKNEDCKVIATLKPNYNLGYIFGTFLGDGCARIVLNKKRKSKSGGVVWSFNSTENEIADKLINAIAEVFNKTAKKDTKQSNQIKVRFYCKPFSHFLKNFGKQENKHLPENLLSNNKEYLRGIFDGLIDSDGCISGNEVAFSNTSQKLIELYNIVSYSVNGYFPNNSKKKPSKKTAFKNANFNNFKTSFVAKEVRTACKRVINNLQVAKLLNLTNTNIQLPVYDLEVDCETHSFIANNAIVHNSTCLTRIETGNGVPQLTAVSNAYFGKIKSESKLNKIGQLKLISDGGHRFPSDLIKSLCFSDIIMLGNLLSGTDESPGEVIENPQTGQKFKRYKGSSTHKKTHIEGVDGLVPYKGKVKKVITHLLEGVASGFSYQNAHNIRELQENYEFVQITNAGIKESHPHDIILG